MFVSLIFFILNKNISQFLIVSVIIRLSLSIECVPFKTNPSYNNVNYKQKQVCMPSIWFLSMTQVRPYGNHLNFSHKVRDC